MKESTCVILQNISVTQDAIQNHYRLIEMEKASFRFAVFLTTRTDDHCEEAFALLPAMCLAHAVTLFHRMVEGFVCACTLQDVVENFTVLTQR